MPNDDNAWMRQDMKKVGAQPATSLLNSKITAGASYSMNSKIAKPTYGMGGLVPSSVVVNFADGGLVGMDGTTLETLDEEDMEDPTKRPSSKRVSVESIYGKKKPAGQEVQDFGGRVPKTTKAAEASKDDDDEPPTSIA